jgi:hypothetical protein
VRGQGQPIDTGQRGQRACASGFLEMRLVRGVIAFFATLVSAPTASAGRRSSAATGGRSLERVWRAAVSSPFLPPHAPPYKGWDSLKSYPHRPSTDPHDFRTSGIGSSDLCVNTLQSPPLCKGRRGGLEASRGWASERSATGGLRTCQTASEPVAGPGSSVAKNGMLWKAHGHGTFTV